MPLMKRRAGITLIEVLISLVILGGGVAAVMGTFPALFELNRSSWNTSQALALAQEKMDEILARRHSISETPVLEALTQLPQCQRISWGEEDPSGHPDLQRIHVYISWSEKWRRRSIVISASMAP